MTNAYREGKDLYATVAAEVNHLDYWDCMEHDKEGKPNPQGEKRRTAIKSVVMGLLYGRQAHSIAEQIGYTTEEAQKLIDDFFNGFPKVKKWIDDTIENAKKKGYVEDLLGRRRRLPEIQLPKYEIKLPGDKFNPLTSKELPHIPTQKEAHLTDKWTKKLDAARGKKQRYEVIDEAAKDNIKIFLNTEKIAQAERQSINARVQGSAATITKLAMIRIQHDEEMKRLGFKLLICVHDELIGECPKENRDAVAERLSSLMIEAAASICSVPMKCDAVTVGRWYEDNLCSEIAKKYAEKIKKGLDEDESLRQIESEYPMVNPTLLPTIVKKEYQFDAYENFINKNLSAVVD